jgi:hypothetical protein
MAKRPKKAHTTFNLETARTVLSPAPATVPQEKPKMAYEHKENTGKLFLNTPKRQPTDPDYSGTINIFGVVTRVALTSADGGMTFTVTGEGLKGTLTSYRPPVKKFNKFNPNGPDVSGEVNVNGTVLRFSGWDAFTRDTKVPILNFRISTPLTAEEKAAYKAKRELAAK